jgi:hypothetical protein
VIKEENLMAYITEYPSAGCRPHSDTIYLRRLGFAFCPVCAKAVELLSFETAAELFGVSTEDIESIRKKGDLHGLHNMKGEILICSDSLFHCFSTMPTQRLDQKFKTVAA